MRGRSKLCALLLAGALALSGCTLARPEGDPEQAESEQDRFIGVYLVYSADLTGDAFSDNPNLTEMGSETLAAGGLGTVEVSRQVLLAERDGDGDWVFPGLEGWALFCTESLEDGVPTSAMASDMADGRFHTTVTDEGVTNDMAGTLYIGPPEGAPADWSAYDMTGVWTPYWVYQTAEGSPYLDGSGDASVGGGIFSYTAEESWTRTVDGEAETVTTRAEIRMEEVPRLAAVTLRQYGADGQLLGSADIPLNGADQQAAWLEDAVWAVVEETAASGETVRTAYDRPGPEGEDVTHPLILLDERGLGHGLTLTLK